MLRLRDAVALAGFILLQLATLFVLFGGGAAVRIALLAGGAPAWSVAVEMGAELLILAVELVVVGKEFLLESLREIFTPDPIPFPTGHRANGWFPGFEGVYQGGAPLTGRWSYNGTEEECGFCRRGEIHPAPPLA